MPAEGREFMELGAPMFNKADAIANLVEEKLPLFTHEIRQALADINKGPPNPSKAAVLDLIKRYPDHFADYIFYKTNRHKLEGSVVWTCPETNHDFHDIDVDVVCRYLRTAYAIEDRLSQIPRSILLKKIERNVEFQRKRDLGLGEIEDEERYFSLPAAYASEECWHHWSGLPLLAPEECAALAMGLDPSLVSLSKVESAVGAGKSAFLQEFRRLVRIFERSGGKRGFDTATISFRRFKQITKSNKINPSSPAMARALGVATPNFETGHVSTPAVHSLYKIVISLALKEYPGLAEQINATAYAQESKDSISKSIYTQMEKDLKKIIPSINDQNLKKYIERAYFYARSKSLIGPPA